MVSPGRVRAAFKDVSVPWRRVAEGLLKLRLTCAGPSRWPPPRGWAQPRSGRSSAPAPCPSSPAPEQPAERPPPHAPPAAAAPSPSAHTPSTHTRLSFSRSTPGASSPQLTYVHDWKCCCSQLSVHFLNAPTLSTICWYEHVCQLRCGTAGVRCCISAGRFSCSCVQTLSAAKHQKNCSSTQND